MKTLLPSLLLAFTLFLLSGCGGSSASDDRPVVAVIPKGTTHLFWQSVHAGALKAGREHGVGVLWVGPEREDDRQQQIALVDNQVIAGVDGIVLAPLDARALRRPVRAAADRGVPVVIIDSALSEAEGFITSFVATNNFDGGRLAGEQLAARLGGKGRVVLLRYAEGSASTENREEGFLAALREFPGIEVVSSEQYGGATKTLAQQASDNLLLRFTNAAGELTIDGIFTPNESTTHGMLLALRRQRLVGEVAFVGFDASEPLLEGLQAGEIDGLVAQNPFRMGYLGVDTLARHLKGEKVPARIDTGVVYVTAESMDDPALQEVLAPDLETYLGP